MNKKNGMWEVPLENQQSESTTNKILEQTTKPELVKYLPAALFSTTTSSLIKAIKKGFLKTWPGLTENLIKRDIEKLRKKTTGHLHMRIQGLQSTKAKTTNK